MGKKLKNPILKDAAIICTIFVIFVTSVYSVKENEQALITRFGRIKGAPVTEKGVHFKIPFLDKVHIFPATEILSGMIITSCPEKFINKRMRLKWVISDVVTFFKTLYNVHQLENYINQSVVTQYCKDSEVKPIIEEDFTNVLKKKLKKLGITVVDIRFSA